jgi:hypothetical protein
MQSTADLLTDSFLDRVSNLRAELRILQELFKPTESLEEVIAKTHRAWATATKEGRIVAN